MSKSKTDPNEKEIKKYLSMARPFLNIPFYVACDPRLSAHAKLVYGLMVMRSFNADNPNSCWMSQELMSANLAVPVGKIKNAIQSLSEHGLINIQQKKGNQGRRNEYHLCDLDQVYSWFCHDKAEWKTLDAVTELAKGVTEKHSRAIERLANVESNKVLVDSEINDSTSARSALQ